MACKSEDCGCACSINGLAHIGVFVSDIEESKKFYTETLGFECYFETSIPADDGDVLIAFVRAGTCDVELVQFPAAYDRKPDGVVAHIAVAVDDIESMQKCLEGKGVKFETDEPVQLPQIFDNGCKYIMCAGPDGETIELNQTL